jgi:hypothetical protein
LTRKSLAGFNPRNDIVAFSAVTARPDYTTSESSPHLTYLLTTDFQIAIPEC